jgi:hypothetical protein
MQLIHASSTGALVALSPAGLTPLAESLWYGLHGITGDDDDLVARSDPE